MGNAEMIDGMIYDGLWCTFEKHHMGISAEWIAREYEVSRQAQDERLSYESHRPRVSCDGRWIVQGRNRTRAAAWQEGETPPIFFDTDETPRRDTTLETLAKLKAGFSGRRLGYHGQRTADQQQAGGRVGGDERQEGSGAGHQADFARDRICSGRGQAVGAVYCCRSLPCAA